MRTLPLALLLLCSSARAAAPTDRDFSELEKEADEQAKSQEGFDLGSAMQADARQLSENMQAQYSTYLKSLADQRAKQEALVRRFWTDYKESTTKKWVDYGEKGDSVSSVDFEKGKVELEVLVPVAEVTGGKNKQSLAQLTADEKKKLRALAEQKLADQAQDALSQTDAEQRPILQDQLKAADGKPVTAETAPKYVHETLAPKMKLDEKIVLAGDGTPRLKATVVVALVPEHMRLRAQRYDAKVRESAARYKLDPALVFAVIQTESEFNPRARSQAPAFGLMQLMPKTGAYEAYKYLNKEERFLTPEELYDPDLNILLGATYLHTLRTRHFPKVDDADKQRILMIAAYNCGPGCVRKYVLAKGDPNSMTTAELLALVKQTVPAETKAYVPKVRGRMSAWKS
jgi:membrane-bound lytic murein transglycosylase C